MTPNGYTAKGYEGVRDAFAHAQAADTGGAQLCVYRHGEKVVDLWAGRDTVSDRPYGQETLTVIMSCTKAATATVLHRLAERGLIDYDAPVADYWPEFAGGGKGEARIWHLLTHSVALHEGSNPREAGAMKSKTTTRFSREVRERAVRMVVGHEGEYDPRWAAMTRWRPEPGATPN